MDLCDETQKLPHKESSGETTRPPLVPSDRNNGGGEGFIGRRAKTREVSSRYKSPTPPTAPRRSISPNLTRSVTAGTTAPKRALSAERKRPSTPTSPQSPTTPVKDSSVDMPVSSRRVMIHKFQEGLWPSTMRSLSVSFQSDSFSIPISKREKPLGNSLSDRTLRLSSNVAQKQQVDATRKPTERKTSPLKGRSGSDQLENSRPVDGLNSRLVDHHRWPARTGGTVTSSNVPSKSLDIYDRAIRTAASLSLPSLGLSRHLPKSSSEEVRVVSSFDGSGKVELNAPSDGDCQLSVSRLTTLITSSSSERLTSSTPVIRTQSLPRSGSRPSSPSKTNSYSKGLISPSRTRPLNPTTSRGVSPSWIQSSAPATPRGGVSPPQTWAPAPTTPRGFSPSQTWASAPATRRGVSPSRTQSSTPATPRGVSPSRTQSSTPSTPRGVSPSRTQSSTPATPRGVSRPSSPSRQGANSSSVLSFFADIRKGVKGGNQIEDAHTLKLTYNRYLQWRYTNAREDDVLYIQIIIAEKTLYNVWCAILALWDSVNKKRITLQQLRLKMKLNLVLNEQMTYLDDWALIERDHFGALSGAIKDLQASTLRLPVAAGARADVESVKIAVCSAVDVMRAMGTSISSLLLRVEGINYVVSELAELAAQERAMLDECKALLASTEAMQVEEYSLRGHLIQLKQSCKKG